jgi:catalase
MTAPKNPSGADGAGSVLSTVAGPSDAAPPGAPKGANPVEKRLFDKAAAEKQLAASMPINPNKPGEYGDASRTPAEGDHHHPATPAATGSTSSEIVSSGKVGSGKPPQGENPTVAPLDRVRVDPGDRHLTTNQGVPVADNQHSLKIGLRGPTAMEDFILREKITHFDHERIPERVVHARGSPATVEKRTNTGVCLPLAAKGAARVRLLKSS